MACKLGIELCANGLANLGLLVGKSVKLAGFIFHRQLNHLETLHELLKVVLELVDFLCDLSLNKDRLVVTLSKGFKLRGDLWLN